MTRVHDAYLRDAMAHVVAQWSRSALRPPPGGDRGWGIDPRIIA